MGRDGMGTKGKLEGKMLKTVKESAKMAKTRLCLVSPQYDA
jgi:hypothetical protein